MSVYGTLIVDLGTLYKRQNFFSRSLLYFIFLELIKIAAFVVETISIGIIGSPVTS